jgi:hypothetical protein
VIWKTSGAPGTNFGDFSGPRATERYFSRLAVQRVENEKNLKHRENTGVAWG